MNTIELALRSYRYLLAKYHPEELKQMACVCAALRELGIENDPELKPLAPLCSKCKNPVANPICKPEVIGQYRVYDSDYQFTYGSVKPHCPHCGNVFIALVNA